MSISSSLSNALSGLNVSSRSAEIVSENLANALTEGYVRRELATSSRVGGVQVDGVIRSVDRGLLADRRGAEATLNAGQRTATGLAKLENIIGSPDTRGSIATRVTDFEVALISASNDPSSELRLSTLTTTLNALTRTINSGSKQIQLLRQDADAAISKDVETLNSNLKMLERLNSDITRSRSVGQDPSSLFDARQQVIDEISGIVPVRELDRGNDQVALITTSGFLLLDGRASQFEFQKSPTITADMSLSSAGLSGILKDGVPLNVENGFGRLSGGSLGAAFGLRDDHLVKAQSSLDEVAFDLIKRFDDPNVDPSVVSVGLLSDAGGPVDPNDITGLASRIVVNSVVDPARGGNLANWRDGVGATVSGTIGNSQQINRWLDALNTPTGNPESSVAGRVANLSSQASAQRLIADRELSFASARWDGLHNAELAAGVDSDVELQNLLRVEQAYAANAKVIQTINSMLQQILEM